MPRRNVQRFSRGPRRKRIWVRQMEAASTQSPTAAAPAQTDLLATFVLAGGPALVGVTIARIRLHALVTSTLAPPAVDVVHWGVRVGGELDEAVDQDPASAVHLDWMAWGALPVYDTTVATGSGEPVERSFDIKSMRKLEELQQTLWLVSGTDAAAPLVTIRWTSSVLVLLP